MIDQPPHAPEPDSALVNPERVNTVGSRLYARLVEERVLPFASVQYFFSEIGPAFLRLDPRELRVTLRIWGTAREGRKNAAPLFAEPLPGIFAVTDARGGHAEHQAVLAAATKNDELKALASEARDNRGLAIGEQVASTFTGTTALESVGEGQNEHLGGATFWSAAGARLCVEAEDGKPASIWSTCNLEWLFPDNPNLWKHFRNCIESGQRPVVLARKIAVSTFPLLKALGAFGLQLHHLYIAQQLQSRPATRALMGGPLLRDALEVRDHKAIARLLPEHLAGAAAEHPGAAEAVELALELQLDQDRLENRAAVIREWADRVSLPLPPRWKAQLTRYVRWQTAFPIP